MFKNLAKQLKSNYMAKADLHVTSPFGCGEIDKLKRLSKHALNLYEKKSDIKNFTKLALSDPENDSHNEIVSKLFNGKDPFSEESLFDLSENSRFLEDLGL